MNLAGTYIIEFLAESGLAISPISISLFSISSIVWLVDWHDIVICICGYSVRKSLRQGRRMCLHRVELTPILICPIPSSCICLNVSSPAEIVSKAL